MANIIIVSIQEHTFETGTKPALSAYGTARKAIEALLVDHGSADIFYSAQDRVKMLGDERIENVIAAINKEGRLELNDGATEILIVKREVL